MHLILYLPLSTKGMPIYSSKYSFLKCIINIKCFLNLKSTMLNAIFVLISNMSRAISATFDTYQKARVQFVQTVAELANHAENIPALQSAGVMGLLRPLLLDNVPAIQQSAALALARLAYNSEELADAVVSNDILPHLVYSLKEQNVIPLFRGCIKKLLHSCLEQLHATHLTSRMLS